MSRRALRCILGRHVWEWKNVNPKRPWQQRRVCQLCGETQFVWIPREDR